MDTLGWILHKFRPLLARIKCRRCVYIGLPYVDLRQFQSHPSGVFLGIVSPPAPLKPDQALAASLF